jgi:hypothetical protein
VCFRPDFDWKLTALARGTLRYAASAFLAFPGLCQTSNANFGSIKPAKGFRLLETEASHAEVIAARPRPRATDGQLPQQQSQLVLDGFRSRRGRPALTNH